MNGSDNGEVIRMIKKHILLQCVLILLAAASFGSQLEIEAERAGGGASGASRMSAQASGEREPCRLALHEGLMAYWGFERGLENTVIGGVDAAAWSGYPQIGLAKGASGLAGEALVLDGESSIQMPYNVDALRLGSSGGARPPSFCSSFSIAGTCDPPVRSRHRKICGKQRGAWILITVNGEI
jgi:hypothetical protein